MICANRASLVVQSDALTVAEITAMLGVEPTASGDVGSPTPAGRSGRDLRPAHLRYQRTYWSPTDYDEGSGSDQTGFAALRRLIATLESRRHALELLREQDETVLFWSGDSDSTQGGFVIESDLLHDLAASGCDLYGTAFLDGIEGD